jgi:hypothetical protein
LDILETGETQCPYCSTHYRLRPGARIEDHQFGGCDLHQHREKPCRQARLLRSDIPATPRSWPGVVDTSGRTTLEQMTEWLRGGAR